MMIAGIVLHGLFYVLWCHRGLCWFANERQNRLLLTVAFAALRALLALLFGIILLHGSTLVQTMAVSILTAHIISYIFLYLPFLWIAWCIVAFGMTGRPMSAVEFFFGMSPQERQWRVYGTLVSCVIDLPQSFLWQLALQKFAGQ